MIPDFFALSQAGTVELGPFLAKATATTPDVSEASLVLSSAAEAEVGVWECTPGTFTARRDGYTEICQFLSGRVTVETTGGPSVTLSAGDTLVMPAGWEGTWHVHETVRKTYITVPVARPTE